MVSRTRPWAGVAQQKRPSAGAAAAPQGAAARQGAAAQGKVSPQGAVTEATESAAPRFVGAVAIALPAGLLIQALIDDASYRYPVVPVVVWLGMLAAAAWLMPRARTGELRIGHAAVAIAVADQVGGAAIGHRGANRPAVCPKGTREVRTGKPCSTHQSGPVPSSRRGRASPVAALATEPPLRAGETGEPVLDML